MASHQQIVAGDISKSLVGYLKRTSTMDRREKARAAIMRAQRQLENARSKREATIKLLIRLDTKTIPALEQAVRRIGKRIDRIDSEAFKAETKPAPAPAKQEPPPIEPVSANPTDDGIPAALRRTPKAKAQAAIVNDFADCVPGPKPPKRKARRSPDDFKAEIDARKGS
jgi:hypothetical protein